MSPDDLYRVNKPRAIYYRKSSFTPAAIQLLRSIFDVVELDSPLDDKADVLATAEVIFAPLGTFFGESKIVSCPKLKVIASNTTGEQHIDTEYARKAGVAVVTLRDETELLSSVTPTAELTWGLIVALTRNVFPAMSSILQGKWERWEFSGERMLSRSVLGIVGMGRLGRMVADYALAARMQVRYYDPHVKIDEERFDKASSLDLLVSESDVVTLHVPFSDDTRNLIDGRVLRLFRTGSYLINTSRGEIVEEEELVSALRSKRLAGAALDVMAGEFSDGFNVKESPIWSYFRSHDNLILTPHIGGSTQDAWEETQVHTIRKAYQKVHSSND